MQLSDVIFTWTDWFKDGSKNWMDRRSYKNINESKDIAQAFIGVRRCGKTTISCLKALQKHPIDDICYINFEDSFFITNNQVDLLDEIFTEFKKLYGKTIKVLILDEIQNINGWERWVRKLVDLKKIYLYLSGSSAKLLSSEISTSLTGRCLEIKIWPLSFIEYLKFKKIKISSEKQELQHLEKYLFEGGFPQVVLEKNTEAKKLFHEQYLQDILFKDIINRYEIRDVKALRTIVQYCLTNISSKHSASSIHKAFNINIQTVQDYLSYCESCFLFFFIKKYDRNLKVQSRNPQKLYCIDNGLRQANAFYHSIDIGKLAENMVFIEILRQGHTVYYYQGKLEVDFLIVNHGHVEKAINVCFSDLNDTETYEREVAGILECCFDHNLNEGIIITRNLHLEEIIDTKKIKFIPMHKFLNK